MTRLEGIARIAALVKRNIEANGGRYNSLFAPNFQSIFDACTLPDDIFNEQVTDERLKEFEDGIFPRFASF